MTLIRLKSNIMNPRGWKGDEEVEVEQGVAEGWEKKGWCEILKADEVKPVVEPVTEPVKEEVVEPTPIVEPVAEGVKNIPEEGGDK